MPRAVRENRNKMKFDKPANENYCAEIVKIGKLIELPGYDRVVATQVHGFQAIVSRDTIEGSWAVMFPAEVQLSEKFCYETSQYRDTSKNRDPNETGYMEPNRRVRAIRMCKSRSDMLLLPLASLAWTGVDTSELRPGDRFDTLAGQQLCRKYEKPIKGHRQDSRMAKATKKFKRIDAKFLPEHYDTARLFGNESRIRPDAEVIVSQKLHGTSIRVGNTWCLNEPTWRSAVAGKLLRVPVAGGYYDHVVGSRKVIKDQFNAATGFYDSDIWTLAGKQLTGMLPKGYIVFGELIGWTPEGQPLQKNYTYDVPQGESRLYVYRVAIVNPDGLVVDLAWPQVQQFCEQRGLLTVPVLDENFFDEFNFEAFLDKRFADGLFETALPLSHPTLVDEGICVRAEGLIPTILKAKSPLFLRHESKVLDDDKAVDFEAEGSAA